MNTKISAFVKKYRHAWVLLYGLIYIPWFCYLEKHITKDYYVIHTSLDEHIPFIEYFIIPYTLWFLYIALTIIYFFFADKAEYYRLTVFLFSGMTIFLIISTIFPNGLVLRPTEFARDNIFVDMVKTLYKADTPTNVLPSIHVFNSIGAYIAISHNERLHACRFIRYSSLILTILIILATMFLKQHSVIDVLAGFLLAGILYIFVYSTERKKALHLSRQLV